MKTIRIATSDWLETEFSVPVVHATPQHGRERDLKIDGLRKRQPFAGEIVSIARTETKTVLFVPSA